MAPDPDASRRGIRWLSEDASRDDLGRGIRWLSEHTPAPEVQQAHLQALRAAVSARPAAAPAGDVTTTHAWKRRVAMGTAWGMLVAAPGVAAAENTKPGDLLYPVKRAGEPLRSLFDQDVAARHRLEELAELLAEGADEERLRRAFEDARAAAGEDEELGTQLRELEERARPTVAPTDDDADDEPSADTDDEQSDDEPSPDDQPSQDEDTEPSQDDEPTDDEPTDDEPTDDEPSEDEPTARPSAADDEGDEDKADKPKDDEPSADEPDDEPTDDEADDEPTDDEA